jgi:chemotaxis protein CheX
VFKIKKELINPFIEAAAQILPQIVNGITFNRTGLLLAKDCAASKEKLAVIILGIVGSVKGRVIYTFENTLACEVAGKMLLEPVQQELTALAGSALAEMTNMVTGRAVALLVGAGYKVDFSPPTLFVGREILVPESDIPAILIPFQTQFGSLNLNVAVKETEK